MAHFLIRPFQQPEDYEKVVPLLNTVLSEPVTAEELQKEEDQIPPGQLSYDEEGRLIGWDRPKWVVTDLEDQVIGYAIVSRAPWNVPGTLYLTLVIHPASRRTGIGQALYQVALEWAEQVKASRLVCFIRDCDDVAVQFAKQRGFTIGRHTFESVLDLNDFDREELYKAISDAEETGIQFVTLADEPGEENERKLYDLYKITHLDLPGFNEEFPWFEEWRKWSVDKAGVRPEWIHIAKDQDSYIGVVTLQKNDQTGAMYHDYTGVHPEYRGRRIALALKMLGIRTAKSQAAPYLRTNNDSMNGPMLRINRDLIGFHAEPGRYQMVLDLEARREQANKESEKAVL